MEIATTPQSPTNTLQTESSSDPGTSAISSDFDTFIKMLTAQIENQDPLNPIESADFAVQLATFSSVEQQVKTNDLLVELGRQTAAQSVGQLSSWVGLETRAVMPAVFDGSPLELSLDGSDTADRLELVVVNNRGAEVQRIDVPQLGGGHVWTGRDHLGTPLPSGIYTMTTQAFSQDRLISEEPVALHSRVVEAGQSEGKVKLTMANGQVVDADKVLGVREPHG